MILTDTLYHIENTASMVGFIKTKFILLVDKVLTKEYICCIFIEFVLISQYGNVTSQL